MRRIFRKHILAGLAVLALALNGCTDDELFHLQGRVEEGIPTRVTLPFQVSKSPVLTRAAIASEYEFRVENLYIFVFDENGNRVWTKDGQDGNNKAFFYDTSGLEDVTEGDENNPTKGTVNFWVGSLNNARIIGIANLQTNTTSTAYSVTEAEMNAINSLAELQETVLPLVNPSVERGSLFLMTGNVETTGADGKPTTSITIGGEEGGSTMGNCTLKLSRTDAKIEVQVTSEASNDQWKNFSFETTTWQVLCVPQQTLLLPYEKDGCDGPWNDAEDEAWDAGRVEGYTCQFFDEPLRPFEEMDRGEQDNTPYYTGGSFVFYMPENRTRYKQKITESEPTKAYALRDEKEHDEPQVNFNPAKPGQQYENKDFMYANDNATYLLLNGHLSYTDAQNYQVDADVTFTIHLGYVSKNANDYDTKRNGHYIYKVTVKGVNDIVVEVSNQTDAGEVRPGYEGNVVYSNQQVYELDSHYDRCLLEISPDKVTDQLMWGVKTPFSAGIHSGSSTDYSGVEDYRWIKFAINKLHDAGHGTYVKYPGDDAYDPDTADPDGLLDIDQLVTYLKEVKATDSSMSSLIPDKSDHICITAFVDEYLYTEDPRISNPTTDLSLWKESVDREDRQMYLIVPFEGDQLELGDIVYSPDGASSVVNSLYTFTQKSIRTVFDVNNQSLRTAWGLESVMETERLPVGNIPGEADNTRNGRANMLKWATGKGWEDVIKTNERYGLNSGYDNAAYACLLRNRDLDGDGTIDGNEIRWYLAAIDQLTDIYLGEYALDEQSQLYPRDAADRPGGKSVYWHYTSSSYNAKDSAPWVLWAEEGASRGSYGGASGSNALNGSNYAYRCIRNLGIPLDNPDEEPDDLVPDVTANADGTYTIDMSRMNPKARRTNRETSPLPRHNEQSAQNRPYTAFVVEKDAHAGKDEPILETRNGGHTSAFDYNTEDEAYVRLTNEHFWFYYQTPNPCPDGYRVPNQRELLIMTTRMTSDQWPEYEGTVTYWVKDYFWENERQESKTISGLRPEYYMSQTSFSMNGTEPYDNGLREGFMWNSSNGLFILQNNRDERGYVRCVRDIDP